MAVGHVEEPTTTGLNHRKLLMWAFLGSDCLLFGSLISTYMIYRGKSVTQPINPRRMCRWCSDSPARDRWAHGSRGY